MKYLICLPMLFLSVLAIGQAQITTHPGEKVILDNDKMRVIEFVSQPMQDNVCGTGMHYHEPHLSILLKDAKLQVTDEDGQIQDVELESGMAVWFEAETHGVVNTGDVPTKILLVYLKE